MNTQSEIEERLAKSRDDWNAWKRSKSEALAFQEGFSFYKRELAGRDFRKVSFSSSSFTGASIADCQMDGALFNGCDGVELILNNLAGATLSQCRFSNIIVRGGWLNLNHASISGHFAEWNCQRLSAVETRWGKQIQFDNCRFAKIDRGSCLNNVVFQNCTFAETQFDGVDISNARFNGETRFVDVDFSGAIVSSGTELSKATIIRSKIDRWTMELLNTTSGLSAAQKLCLKIEHPVAKMRMAFSGVMQYIHTVALIVFLSPYLLFLLEQHFMRHVIVPGEPTITLAEKFLRYVITGGNYHQVEPAYVLLILFLFAYNINRAILLWKTKHLENEEASTRMPARFLLKGGWKYAYELSHYGVWVNVTCVLFHTYHFMQTPVPVPK